MTTPIATSDNLTTTCLNEQLDRSSIAQPQGGFQWKDKWEKQLAVVRGVQPAGAPGQNPQPPQLHVQDRPREEAAAAPEDIEAWLTTLREHYRRSETVDACLKKRGIPFTLRVLHGYHSAARPARGFDDYQVHDDLRPLRLAIAQADDAQHAEALATALTLREQGAGAWICHVFPHQAQWAETALATKPRLDTETATLLMACVLPPTQARHCIEVASLDRDILREFPVAWDQMIAATLLQIRLHERDALEVASALVTAHKQGPKKYLTDPLAILASLHVPGMLKELAGWSGHEFGAKELEKHAKAHPAAVLRVLFDRPPENVTTASLLRRIAAKHPAALRQALDALTPEAQLKTIEAFALAQAQPAATKGTANSGEQAQPSLPDNLPACLREPPWLARGKANPLSTVIVAPLPGEEKIHFTPEEREKAFHYQPWQWTESGPKEEVSSWWRLTPDGLARLLRGELLQPGDVDESEGRPYGDGSSLMSIPEPARLPLWNSYPAQYWRNLGHGPENWLLARYDTAAIPGFVAIAQAQVTGFAIALPVETVQLVAPALETMKHQKKGRAHAQAWLKRYPRTALLQALPAAFQPTAGRVRENARFGVRWLAAQGHAALCREVAALYGAPLVAALDAFLAMDPLMLDLPARIPPFPSFVVPEQLPAPRLVDGTEIPTAAAAHIVMMLAMSKLDAPYAGLFVLKEACRSASLAEFAWGVYQAWEKAGAPTKDNWAFTGLGLLGDDETARRLAELLKRWPSEGLSARAMLGVEVMAAIGSDVALTHLETLSRKAKTSSLRESSAQRIKTIADTRDLTPDQLADRLVPRMGLDSEGADVLDFGPRRFFLHFDEELRPIVKDADGTRQKDLPKPAKSDNAYAAEEATRRFKQVQKDARLIAQEQVGRFELAMTTRRRFTGLELRTLFVGHPVLRHLAAGLAWAVYDGDLARVALRIAEDWTFADEHDATFALDDDAVVGILHPLDVPLPTLERLRTLFDDYKVAQPFKQLARETFALTPDEQEAKTLTRWQDRVFVCASVLGLAKKGWKATGGGGRISDLSRSCGDSQIYFRMEPGTQIGNPLDEPRQRILRVELSGPQATFGSLGPVLASEVLREFELLPLAPR